VCSTRKADEHFVEWIPPKPNHNEQFSRIRDRRSQGHDHPSQSKSDSTQFNFFNINSISIIGLKKVKTPEID
jgi:hypothetical protein